MKAVALGGGHGLSITLASLRELTDDITAVVTVADDGGSSGRMRRELDLLPPGDLRKAITALAGADHPLLAEVFGHRFGGDGVLAGHAVGNMLLGGMLEVLADPVRALDETMRLFGARGRVLPMCVNPLDIEADVIGLDADPRAVRRIRGQVAVATTPGKVQRIRLHGNGGPEHPPVACREAVEAVLEADLVLLGPGSWFTSVLPHLLVPELHDALVETAAQRVVVVNLVPQPGETSGFSQERHLYVLHEHAPRLRVDAVVADTGAVDAPGELRAAATALDAHVELADVARADAGERHDPVALASAIRKATQR
ncbi:gluconeogenesis factor YvcK family protein [Sciscionella sediminilitoris]|uniref:gluconeogenesis factor YvcK family protein n=1 Tax=Sciscionella sediminilitoris TaxID=1445613 RepID=UPI0004DF39C4|nr:uridine diphosphate-N-acetylglucosamine-binding protein YvcK [Sciscionella sp. SE31]